jgi:hypothetical protein
MPRLHLVSSPMVKDVATTTAVTPTDSSEASTNSACKHQMHSTESYSSVQTDVADPVPQFVKHKESTNIELFYDLFFVANLTTFSNVHEVNSRKALTSYMGFFCILWFTWCQTSLFDIRFVTDSWMERMAKACHLGVMVGLAVVGPNYDTEVGKKDPSMQTMVGDSDSQRRSSLLTRPGFNSGRFKVHSWAPISTYYVPNPPFPKDKTPSRIVGRSK